MMIAAFLGIKKKESGSMEELMGMFGVTDLTTGEKTPPIPPSNSPVRTPPPRLPGM